MHIHSMQLSASLYAVATYFLMVLWNKLGKNYIPRFNLLLYMYLTGPYWVEIVPNTLGIPVQKTNNTVGYFLGSDLSLTCLVTPTPPANSTFSWSCSTCIHYLYDCTNTVAINILLTPHQILANSMVYFCN